MPAMSPTMEKGGIVNWKFKPGDTFQAGDVLLEVETDKAQIDVEAQDDGQMVKILVQDGTKDINVGTTIAYLAEPDDDITQLGVPKDTKDDASTAAAKEAEPLEKGSKPSDNDITKSQDKETWTMVDSGKLLPSVAILCAQSGISEQEAREKIAGSGFQGKILKGDVLAYLNKIPRESVDKISQYVSKNSKLDLSNIELKLQQPVTDSAVRKDSTESEVKGSTQGTAPLQTDMTPITFTEDIIFSTPQDVTLLELQQSINNFIKEAYQYSHEPPFSPSEHFDPIFEDLVTIDPRKPRFQFDYNLIALNSNNYKSSESRDIFDILTSSNGTNKNNSNENSDTTTSPKENDYLLTINVDVNNKYSDAMKKSEKFINYIKQLEGVAA